MLTTKILGSLLATLSLSFATAQIAFAAEPVDAKKPTEDSAASAYVSDSSVTAKVKAALLSNTITGVSVTTDQGVVALSGTVPNEEVRQQATKIASNIDGVRGVD